MAIVLVSAMVFFVYKWLQPPAVIYNTVQVASGDIVQEISESGFLKKGDSVNLNFKNSGTIAKVHVSVGQKVAVGQELAELDTAAVQLRAKQAEAGLNVAVIKLKRLLNGASTEDLRIAASKVETAKIAKDNAAQNLNDARRTAEERIANAYDDAIDVLSDVYETAYNAQNFVVLLQRTYFAPQGADGIAVFEDVQTIKDKTSSIKLAYETTGVSSDRASIDSALRSASSNLTGISKALLDIRDICEKVQWRDSVTAADKTALDANRNYINAAIATITSASQTITNQLVANDYSINTATSAFNTAASLLKSAEEEYSGITASPRSEDVALLQTQVAQGKAELELLEKEIADAVLRSPIDAQVVAVNKRAGELAQPLASDPVIEILPYDPYQIDVDIYEEDIVKVNAGDAVEISLTAYPDREFFGRILSIDPADKMVNGVVYYPIKIGFDDAPSGIKPGMSVDIAINAVLAKNCLKIPEGALQKKNGGYFVAVLDSGQPREQAVTVGARSKTEVEILSGLRSGDQVIMP